MWGVVYTIYIVVIGAISILSKHLLAGLLLLIFLPLIFAIWAFFEGLRG
jgi:hypothetical protein